MPSFFSQEIIKSRYAYISHRLLPVLTVITLHNRTTTVDAISAEMYYDIGAIFHEPQIVNLLDSKEIHTVSTQLNLSNDDKDMLLHILQTCNIQLSHEQIYNKLQIVPQKFLYLMIGYSERIASWYIKNCTYDLSDLESIQKIFDHTTQQQHSLQAHNIIDATVIIHKFKQCDESKELKTLTFKTFTKSSQNLDLKTPIGTFYDVFCTRNSESNRNFQNIKSIKNLDLFENLLASIAHTMNKNKEDHINNHDIMRPFEDLFENFLASIAHRMNKSKEDHINNHYITRPLEDFFNNTNAFLNQHISYDNTQSLRKGFRYLKLQYFLYKNKIILPTEIIFKIFEYDSDFWSIDDTRPFLSIDFDLNRTFKFTLNKICTVREDVATYSERQDLVEEYIAFTEQSNKSAITITGEVSH